MVTFTATSEESIRTANQVMREASGMVRASEFEAVPGLRAVAAGAALVLEKSPPLGRSSDTSKAQDWLDPWASEGAVFMRAIGQIVEARKGPTVIDQSPADLMRHIVTNVNAMQSADWMTQAVDRGIDPKAIGLAGGQLARVESAREDPEVAQAIRDESRGAYHRLPHSRQLDLIDVFHGSEGVPAAAMSEIAAIASDMGRVKDGGQQRNDYLHAKISDFVDAEIPLFRDADLGASERRSAAMIRAHELSLGIGDLPRNEVERGVVAHVAVTGPQTHGRERGAGLDARGRILAELDLSDLSDGVRVQPDPVSASASQVAVRIEAMSIVLTDADVRTSSALRQDADLQELAMSSPSRMSRCAQVGLFETLHHGDVVAPLMTARLQSAVRDMDAVDRSLSQDQQLETRRDGQAMQDTGMIARQRAAEFSRG